MMQTFTQPRLGMRITVEHSDDPKNPILHTSRFILIDSVGQLRGAYDSDDQQDLRQLEADLKSLMHSEAQQAETGDTSPELMHEDSVSAEEHCMNRSAVAGATQDGSRRPWRAWQDPS